MVVPLCAACGRVTYASIGQRKHERTRWAAARSFYKNRSLADGIPGYPLVMASGMLKRGTLDSGALDLGRTANGVQGGGGEDASEQSVPGSWRQHCRWCARSWVGFAGSPPTASATYYHHNVQNRLFLGCPPGTVPGAE